MMTNSGVHDAIPVSSSTTAGRRGDSPEARTSGAGWSSPTREKSGPMAAASGRLRASQTGRAPVMTVEAEDIMAPGVRRHDAGLPFDTERVLGLQAALFAVAIASAFFM